MKRTDGASAKCASRAIIFVHSPLTNAGHMMHATRMKFSEWLALNDMSDEEAAKAFDRDRAHISKLRRGKTMPSYPLMLKIREASDQKVTLESWEPEPVKLKRKTSTPSSRTPSPRPNPAVSRSPARESVRGRGGEG